MWCWFFLVLGSSRITPKHVTVHAARPKPMNTTFAPSHWPASAAVARRDAGWRFAREFGSHEGWAFELKRNVSLTPRQLLAAFGLLSALSLLVALGFWSQGVSMVMVFTAVELLAVGVALLVAARHAGDRELITLAEREVAVEQHFGAQVDRATFRAEWLRVEPVGGQGSLVELSGEGRSVRIGRHVRPELRVDLAQEIRRALRLTRAANDHVLDHELKT